MFKKHNVLEFSFSEISDIEVQEFLLRQPRSQEITILFEGDEISFPGFLFVLKEHFLTIHFALRLTRKTQLKAFSKTVPFWIFTQLHVLPVPFNIHDSTTLTCGETKKVVAKLLEKGARATPLPYRDFAADKPGEASGVTVKWASEFSAEPYLSVIIPTRNYEAFLINVLRHLFDQTLARRDYEVIVVDDGGTDQSFDKAKMLLGPLSSEINFKYIYHSRAPGEENHFRAGHCRNIGIEHSRGKWVLFLDSDILVKKNFFRRFNIKVRNGRRYSMPSAAHSTC